MKDGEAKDGEAKDGEAKDGEAKDGEAKDGETKAVPSKKLTGKEKVREALKARQPKNSFCHGACGRKFEFSWFLLHSPLGLVKLWFLQGQP